MEKDRLHNKTHLVYEAIRWITARYAPQIRVIKDGQGHLLTEPGEVKQRWRQYFDTLYNDRNAINEDYNEKHSTATQASETMRK